MQELGLPLWGLIDDPFSEPDIISATCAGDFYFKHPEYVEERIKEINQAYPKVPSALHHT